MDRIKYILAILLCILPMSFVTARTNDVLHAPEFTATDEYGRTFNLTDYNGEVILLHFTGLESPLCAECFEAMKGQVKELEKLSQSNHNVTLITINIRKNPYSDTGNVMAERDFGVNVSWHWIEEYSPFQIASLYQEYWTYQDVFSNPTIVLIDQHQHIVGVYNIYCIGKGSIDGIQSVESLNQDILEIQKGTFEYFRDEASNEGLTFLGIFVLGILTAATPCSIALLVAMISYVGSLQKDSTNTSKKLSLQGLWIGIIFTLGMSLVFFIFGIVISSIGIFIEASTVFYLIAGIILIILGMNIIKPLKELMNRQKKETSQQQLIEKGQSFFVKLSQKSIYLGAFFLGILFSIGWAPCALSLMMPVFILTLTQKISIITGGVLLFVFGLGHGIPIIPLCAVTSGIRGKVGNKYVTAGKWMQKIFGIIIISIGVIMALRFWGINFW